VQRVTYDMAPHFAPLEVAIRTKFLPALLGIAALDLDGKFCKLLTHSVKTGGIAIRNPMNTTVHVNETSLRATSHLIASMVDRDTCLDLEDHRDCGKRKFVDPWGVDKPAIKCQDILARAAELWLLVIPDHLNGTSLSVEDFRDHLWLRYNFLPLDMPQLCNDCGAPMTVKDTLCCKVGSLVHIQHDNVADE
jgi:hypothetical protein